jgi:hypothetical protein
MMASVMLAVMVMIVVMGADAKSGSRTRFSVNLSYREQEK